MKRFLFAIALILCVGRITANSCYDGPNACATKANAFCSAGYDGTLSVNYHPGSCVFTCYFHGPNGEDVASTFSVLCALDLPIYVGPGNNSECVEGQFWAMVPDAQGVYHASCCFFDVNSVMHCTEAANGGEN